MLELRALLVYCFMCGFFYVHGMNSTPSEFVHFLSKQHYLDGSRSVTPRDSEYVDRCISNFTIDDVFSNVVLHSFADNIAFVAAQARKIDFAAEVLFKSYVEDRNNDNWLFEELRQANEEITFETIRESLVSAYMCVKIKK